MLLAAATAGRGGMIVPMSWLIEKTINPLCDVDNFLSR